MGKLVEWQVACRDERAGGWATLPGHREGGRACSVDEAGMTRKVGNTTGVPIAAQPVDTRSTVRRTIQGAERLVDVAGASARFVCCSVGPERLG